MTRDELVEALTVERFGPPPLSDAAAPWPVDVALEARRPPGRRRGHLVMLPGGAEPGDLPTMPTADQGLREAQ